MSEAPDLQLLRDSIEEIDRGILAHLRQRMNLVEQVAATELRAGYPLPDEAREDLVLQRLRRGAAEAGLDPDDTERFYRVLLDLSVARQDDRARGLAGTPLRVAYLETEGSHSRLTLLRRYGGKPERVRLEGFGTLRAAVEAVCEGAADCAFLPIEDTTAGSINETYDLLAESGLSITAEAVSRIEHSLLGLHGTHSEETRFVELSRRPARFAADAPAKISLLVTLRHQPAALSTLLGVFARWGMNLTKVESRPILGSPFQYRFYLDFEGNADSDPARGALAEAKPFTVEMRLLGNYPAAGPWP